MSNLLASFIQLVEAAAAQQKTVNIDQLFPDICAIVDGGLSLGTLRLSGLFFLFRTSLGTRL
jgi:hypothetical protein